MNLLLLDERDKVENDTVCLNDRRYLRLWQRQTLALGQQVPVGIVGGQLGLGEVIAIAEQQVCLRLSCTEVSPPLLPITLIIALPRPKMLKRILQTAATLGVEKIIWLNSFRVEKSYWQSPELNPELMREQLLLGLEQAKTTVLPQIEMAPLFKPFVQDQLPALIKNKLALVAHPVADCACPVAVNQPCVVIIGPEGGFIPYEINLLQEQGVQVVHLGARILRVETAVTALVARLWTDF